MIHIKAGTFARAVTFGHERLLHRSLARRPICADGFRNLILQPRRVSTSHWLSNNGPSRSAAGRISESDKSWHLPPPPASSPIASEPLQRLKHPARGGQDLTHRYARLERALRGKEAYERDIEEYEEDEADASAEAAVAGTGGTPITVKRKGKTPFTFAGFAIPEKPKPPGPDECCMSGCAVCVYDLYDEAEEAYENALGTLRAALFKKSIPENTWPAQIRRGRQGASDRNLAVHDPAKARQVTLSAFEQLELQLASRRIQDQKQNEGRSSPGLSQATENSSGDAGSYNRESVHDELAMLHFDPNDDVTHRSKRKSTSIRGSSRSSIIDGKAIIEALSWMLFSRR
ncbi:uncharacterized protein FOMMEDRAFT_165862 [Fomitiporia mediterranea MF3/22]|uniref:uncharacterized protein n=1 Tax=Fomitiporia mediterranea (strain MF3/22) TaxID=694068 RepID=UPI00044091AC|nr:uncharacterized protein FOMMEDRAFT_165862 [Fomitiporia mediterranea MF3/22]EJD05443.1 hypothetical protein FOMMEDRAFT_165862 [Fomitiporia mediterranea MF3/22]